MSGRARSRRDPVLKGWTPIIGALSIWFAHFLIAWGAGSIWPDQWLAKAVTIVATLIALAGLAWLFLRFRAARPHGDQTVFARRFGLGSIYIATAATVFDAIPALIG